MAGKKSLAAYWSFLASDDRIKGLIEYELQSRGWTRAKLAEEMGFHKSRLSCYFNNKPRGLTDIQIVYMLEQLGWELTVKATKDEISE
jgi:transcriptional regulator with XRE-family HTH domain